MDRTLRLASAPINWGVGPLTPDNPAPDAMLDAIAEAGYEGCELGTYGLFGTRPDEILARFRARGLALVATWHHVDLAKPLSAEDALQIKELIKILAAGGGGPLLLSDLITAERIAVAARVDEHPETWWGDGDWTQARRTLLAIAAIAAERGVAIAIHPHVGCHLESGWEIRHLLDLTASDPVGLCLDTGHVRIGGSDPIALLERECGRLIHVHAKDVDGAVLDRLRGGAITYGEAVRDGLYSDLGTGIVGWQGLRRGLAACGYGGWVVAEQDRAMIPADPGPFESSRRNRAFLQALLNA